MASARTRSAARLSDLAVRYGLDERAEAKLRVLLRLLVEDPLAPTSIRDPRQVIDDHLADSLVALELDAVRSACVALDLGSGAGLPGLPLAIALPRVSFTLLESAARKCAFLKRAAAECEIGNVEVVHARAEVFAEGLGRHDLVTARAVTRLEVVAEYAAPLLRVGGTLVAWAGRRDAADEAAGARAVADLGLERFDVRPARPYARAKHRHLYLTRKLGETPARFPRRPGMALKRPLGAGISGRRGQI